MYPCTAQAASVVRGKGFAGLIEVLPLGFDDAAFFPGTQSGDDDELVLRWWDGSCPRKACSTPFVSSRGSTRSGPRRLLVVGDGPEAAVPVRWRKSSVWQTDSSSSPGVD